MNKPAASSGQNREPATSDWHPYALDIAAVAERLGTHADRGLTGDDARRRLEEFGPNELASEQPEPWWKKLAAQFTNLVIWILLAAAAISGVHAAMTGDRGDWVETIAILAIVILNGTLGFLQEERAERAIERLRGMSKPTARVVRDGAALGIPSAEVVPGDILHLEAGDYVAADARLTEAFGLRIEEAALTGESLPVDKVAQQVLEQQTPLADRVNMVYMGTVAVAGKATAIVTGTGMQTELGRIAGLLGRFEREQTPLERRLAELGRVLIAVCLVLVGVIFALQLWRGGELGEVFLVSVSLAVAAVPEGLPAVVTISLALGLQRMVKRNALVRKLPSVETLGSVTVICSDKTGTLTRNEMTVRELATASRHVRVTGVGYAPEGEFASMEPDTPSDSAEMIDAELRLALVIGARCNNAHLEKQESGWRVLGDPTEGALVVVARKAGIEPNPAHFHPLAELPFDSDRKTMSVVVADESGKPTMYTKGAPEAVLSRCSRLQRGERVEPISDDSRRKIEQAAAAMASRALRVLALAYRPVEPGSEKAAEEQELVFVGLAGMIDPPREEAKPAIARCREAGIRPVMITGDHPVTAIAVARELGLAAENDEAMTGVELDTMDDRGLEDRVEQIPVYARVSAEHKLRVVSAWQKRRHVVAMTGDGVNDAPAIKSANIGIAMGITGTDVTKEASDMVLTDDNFASIVGAVEEGRGIFDNIQKFVQYLLSCNAGEVMLMFVAAMLGWAPPLVAIQILWINLVTDGLPALALAMEPPEPDVMGRPPRPSGEPVITLARGVLIVGHGTLIAAAAACGFYWVYSQDPESAANLANARTTAFSITAFSQLFYSLACRSQRYTLPELGVFSNPYLFGAIAASALLQVAVVMLPGVASVFQAVPQTENWLVIVPAALAPVTIIESIKLVRAGMRPPHPTRDP